MSEMQFTPGPWTVGTLNRADDEGYCTNINAPGWSQFARVVTRQFGKDEPYAPGIANARLIAAAPELYEALSELLRSDEFRTIGDDTPEEFRARRAAAKAKARAALSKAQPEGK